MFSVTVYYSLGHCSLAIMDQTNDAVLSSLATIPSSCLFRCKETHSKVNDFVVQNTEA
jgi:hypothetical protein